MRTTILLFIIYCFAACTSCDENETDNNFYCDYSSTIDANLYENTTTENVSITEAEILNDCILLTFSSSGCDGNSWQVQLIADDGVLESSPPQRNLKFKLVNDEACLAIISKSNSFDISNLQVEGATSVYLNIEGLEDSLLYEY